MDVFELQASLTLDSSKFDKGVDDASKAFKDVASGASDSADAMTELQAEYNRAQAAVKELSAALNEYVSENGSATGGAQELAYMLAEEQGKAADAQAAMKELAQSENEAGEEASGAGDKVAVFGDMLKASLASDAIQKAISALKQLIVETAEYGDNVDKASQKLGISSKAYQEWEAVLQHSGTSMSAMTATFKTLANAVEDSTDDQIAAFKKIGLSIDDLKGKSTEDIFKEVITGLQKMESGTERTAVAIDLLGRGAMELGPLLNTSAEDTQAMIDRVNALGGVMSEQGVKESAAFQDAMQDLGTAFQSLAREAIEPALPLLTKFANGITDAIAGARSYGFDDTISGIESFSGQLSAAMENVDAWNEKLNGSSENMAAFGQSAWGAYGRAVYLGNGVEQATEQLEALRGSAEVQAGVLDEVADGLLSAAEAADLLGITEEEVADRIKAVNDAMEADAVAAAAAKEAEALAELQEAWENAYTSAKESAEKQFGLFERVPEVVRKSVEDAKSSLSDMSSSLESQSKYWNDYADNIQKAIGLGVDKGLIEKLSDGSKESAQILADIVDTGGDSIGELNAKFAEVEEGESRFAEAVANMQTGMEQAAGPMATAAENVVDGAIQPFEQAAEETHQIGVNFALGFADGISSQLSVIISAATEAGDAARVALKNALGIASPSKVARELGVFFDEGFAEGIEDGGEEITETMVTQARNMLTYWGDAMKNGTVEMSAELGEMFDRLRGVVRGYYVEQNREIATLTAESWGIAVQGGKLGVAQVGNTYAEIVESLGTITKQNTEQAAEIVYTFGKNSIDKLVKYGDLSLSEEIAMLENLQQAFVENSEQYNELADTLEEKRYKQRKEYLENLEDVEKDYYDSVADFEDRVKDIYDEIDAISQGYLDAVADRAAELAGTWGLFEQVQEREPVSGNQLIQNLRGQVQALEEYGEVMATLEERGVEGALLEELRSLGPDSLAELKALASLSDEQLDEYAELFGEKQEKGNELALHELENLKTESEEKIQEQIDDLQRLYDEEAPKIGEALDAALIAGMESGYDDVLAKAEEIARGALDRMQSTLGFSWDGGSFQTNKVSFDESALAQGSAAIVNSNAAVQAAQSGDLIVPVTLADGTEVARAWLPDFINVGRANGTPIANATM